MSAIFLGSFNPLLTLVPDIAMVAYLINPRVGAILYNLVHSYILPVGFLAAGWLTHSPLLLQVGLIWTTHIGLDRMLGFGLKYPTAFRDTHLQRV
ncbi:DUF4260 domain-containing protein [Effusibacillus pohliae]|uniref:DUF4260 domain-containing protein n=1 Tax=Effusibacillus pohliae TaxID=232270 RepID=UPI0012E9DD76